MRRVLPLVVVFFIVPGVASATELDELLDRGREAGYTAEQLTTCTTPDGIRDALIRIEQSGAEIRVTGDAETELAVGAGGWELHGQDGVVTQATVGGSSDSVVPVYDVEDLGEVGFMGREAMAYRLERDGVLRAELVFDSETGALVRVVTYDASGDTYCDRRFVSFDPVDPELPAKAAPLDTLAAVAGTGSVFPEEVTGFTRLDLYEEDDGFKFAYYSDGFFSFAAFETPRRIELDDAVRVEFDDHSYRRVFTAGQVIYVWESDGRGMALVGDLPPDLHESVLASLPEPTDPGLFRRIWRTLFG
ncbi:MAG: hypothetical protein L0Z47_02260 [Actinobacteria bacterium]|nr:hypothetical protein [Actinomycetota bacterium]